MNAIIQRRQHNFRRERQGRNDRPWGDCAVIGTIGHTTCGIIEESTPNAVYFEPAKAGAIARGYSPAAAIIASKFEWIIYRVLLPDISCTATILKIIDTFIAHEVVLNITKINPDMRELMREQRPGIKILITIAVGPCVSGSPRCVAAFRQRKRRRA